LAIPTGMANRETSKRKANFGVSCDEDLRDWLDEIRGPIPRSRYIAAILQRVREATVDTQEGDA